MKKLLCVLFFAMLLAACSAPGYAPHAHEYMPPFNPFIAYTAPPTAAPTVAITGDDMPVTRAQAAKMLALAFASPSEIRDAQRIISFADTDPRLWHDHYINTVYTLNLMGGAGALFHPDEPLTTEQAQILLERLDPDNHLRIRIDDNNRHMAISYALWVDLYIQTLYNLSLGNIYTNFGIASEKLIILATSGSHPQLPPGHTIAAQGHFASAGLNLAPYMNREIYAIHRAGQIIAVVGVVNNSPTIPNAYIVRRGEGFVTIFTGGIERTFLFDGDIPAGVIADIRINAARAEDIRVFGHLISGAVIEANPATIEIAGIGRIPTHPHLRIYSTAYGAVRKRDLAALTVGADIAEFVLRDGMIAAAIITRRPAPAQMRVVISTTGFSGYIHNHVEIFGNEGLTLRGVGVYQHFDPGEILRIDPGGFEAALGAGRLYISPRGGGQLAINSIRRAWPDNAPPKYRGTIEISRHGSGFVIVNELCFEEYLYGVIPSEMPTAHGLEAAKVQAITARSYAYNQFHANRFHALGANIDDSIHSQVFNNIPETEISRQAVRATAGQFLAYDGRIVAANFFSTSAGVTANFHDVWKSGYYFDEQSPAYLQARRQYSGGGLVDKSDEGAAREFFSDTNIAGFDADFPWFRWNLALTHDQMTRIINRNLAPPITAIGEFTGMEVVSRGQGGNIREIKIHGTAASALIRTEYSIRRLLAPNLPGEIIEINRHNAAPAQNFFMLPSTFFTFTDIDGIITIHGGGFGHGVGMSQNGVRGMIDRGYNYHQILAHFYPGTMIVQN
ncbi:MAG: SpoIID/LytB domain-containing protein [Defluviitaleaceae bacterium]|nr:SpoIID/LytB domain-containing protein [Defluviitaleaceae bacterium]